MRAPRACSLLACLSLLLLVACGGGRKADLGDTLRDFNQQVRWGSWMAAARHVDAKSRSGWLRARVVAAASLRVTDVQLLGVQPQSEDTAIVLVGVSWYRVTDPTLRQRIWQQTWRYDDEVWLLAEEVVVQQQTEPQKPAAAWP